MKLGEVLGINLTFFFCGQFHVKLTKNVAIFSIFWLKKWNWLWFHTWNWLKLWNRSNSVRIKNWNWRPRRSRVPSVSIFFPTEFWRFHNFMPVSSMKPSASFIFWANKNSKTKQPVSSSFHVKLCHITK